MDGIFEYARTELELRRLVSKINDPALKEEGEAIAASLRELDKLISESKVTVEDLNHRFATLASDQSILSARRAKLAGDQGLRDYRQAEQIEHENEVLSEKIELVEEEELQILEEIEEFSAKIMELEALREKTAKSLAAASERYESRLGVLREEQRTLQGHLDGLAGSLEEPLLARLAQARRETGGSSVAIVSQPFCSNCHIGLSSSLWSKARTLEPGAVSCEECGVLLLFVEGEA